MESKKTTVTLKANGVAVAFPFCQAERLLKLKKNGGWLLNDQNFEFVDNELRFAKAKESDEKVDGSKGDKTPKPRKVSRRDRYNAS